MSYSISSGLFLLLSPLHTASGSYVSVENQTAPICLSTCHSRAYLRLCLFCIMLQSATLSISSRQNLPHRHLCWFVSASGQVFWDMQAKKKWLPTLSVLLLLFFSPQPFSLRCLRLWCCNEDVFYLISWELRKLLWQGGGMRTAERNNPPTSNVRYTVERLNKTNKAITKT